MKEKWFQTDRHTNSNFISIDDNKIDCASFLLEKLLVIDHDFVFSPFTYSMVKRETNAVVGTLEVEDYFENGITYCRIDTQGVVARYR